MYPFLHALLADRKGGPVFTCFGAWHLGYIVLTAAVIALVCLALRHKPRAAGERAATVFSAVAFGLYIADFFLMPFAYEEIDVEKLPFHICTAMCVACWLSRRVAFLKPLRGSFALLGFLSNLVYLIYPAGVMWHAVHPLCYRVVQTLLFHSCMTVFGFLALLYDEDALRPGAWKRDLAVIVGMTAWAVIGNTLYNGAAGSYDHFFNWFFVCADPFGLVPKSFAPFVMPFVNIALFFSVERVLSLLFRRLRALSRRSDDD